MNQMNSINKINEENTNQMNIVEMNFKPNTKTIRMYTKKTKKKAILNLKERIHEPSKEVKLIE